MFQLSLATHQHVQALACRKQHCVCLWRMHVKAKTAAYAASLARSTRATSHQQEPCVCTSSSRVTSSENDALPSCNA